jgi:hypothetical protein
MIKKKTLVTPAKKLAPATIVNQKKWASFPLAKKNQLRKMLPDKDKDGVPNKFDCQPKNKRKQESFLPADESYLNSGNSIELGKSLGRGMKGEIHEVKGRRHLVIKTPIGFSENTKGNSTRGIGERLIENEYYIDREAETCEQYNTNNHPLFIPTKVVKLKTKSGLDWLDDSVFTGLVRPRITPIVDYSKDANSNSKHFSDAQIRDIRNKLIDLSYKGFIIGDGLQLGIDYAHRLLLYDVDELERDDPQIAFKHNQKAWERLFLWLGFASNDSALSRAMQKYGRIEPNGASSQRRS